MTVQRSLRGFAGLLWRLSDLVQAAERSRSFRARAYRTAIWALDDISGVEADDEELMETAGIGPGVTALFNEYRSTGAINQLIPLEEAYPKDSALLRRLPRMSPTMLRELKTLGVETTADLRQAVSSGAAETIRGAGPHTLHLWRRILELSPGSGWMPAHQAWVVATSLASHIGRHTESEVELAGPVRRVEEWADGVDLVVATDRPEKVRSFLGETAVLRGPVGSSSEKVVAETHAGMRVETHITTSHSAGTALFVATGPPDHVARMGQVGDHASEVEVYRESGLPWIPPPARVLPVAAATGVVGLSDIRGDLHLHSEASPDGRMSLETIVASAVQRGYDYILITDHTEGLRFGGLGVEDLAQQAREIDQLRSRHPGVKILHGAELNIGPDGSLDILAPGLDRLDFAVTGVHSHFGLTRAEQTDRVISALSHPVVRILAHPFGRRIGIRPCLDIDMGRVVEAAVAMGVALETNGHRDRLDLP
ncbi:MAG TPA: PHP domain-containing protein, partial [Acidimicrobiia bacterium]|nr:PHP domain-containing protein [Acidimicrobiia bacterium]